FTQVFEIAHADWPCLDIRPIPKLPSSCCGPRVFSSVATVEQILGLHEPLIRHPPTEAIIILVVDVDQGGGYSGLDEPTVSHLTDAVRGRLRTLQCRQLGQSRRPGIEATGGHRGLHKDDVARCHAWNHRPIHGFARTESGSDYSVAHAV